MVSTEWLLLYVQHPPGVDAPGEDHRYIAKVAVGSGGVGEGGVLHAAWRAGYKDASVASIEPPRAVFTGQHGCAEKTIQHEGSAAVRQLPKDYLGAAWHSDEPCWAPACTIGGACFACLLCPPGKYA